MDWLFWFVVGGFVLGLLAALVAWLVYPVRRHQRELSAARFQDPATGGWAHVPETRKELWRRS